MASSNLKPRVRGASGINDLNTQQRVFCLEMLANELRSPTQAARNAGYRHPSQMAAKLMAKPSIKALLGRFQREREERTKVTSEQIWAYLGRVLFYNPLALFESDEQGWHITDLENIPTEIGQMIEEIETVPTEEGSKVRIRLVSKAKALEIAARHALPQTQLLAMVKPVIDYEELSRPSDLRTIDVVAKRLELEQENHNEDDSK